MIGTAYDKIVDRFSSARTRLQGREIEYLALVLDPLAQNSTVLDLGCGTGHPIATHIASRGHHVVGVDASGAMLEVARKHLPEHRWIHGLMESVQLDEVFCSVVCWDSVFHLPRRQFGPVLRKMYRWLRPGGRMMVSSGGIVSEGESGFTATMFGHEFFYDSLPPQRMVALIENIGFEILIAEMCELPDGGDGRGKWATIAERKI